MRSQALQLMVTNHCPLDCRFCHFGHVLNTAHMPLPLLVRVLSQARATGISKVVYNGGEPLIYPWLEELLKESNRQGMEPLFVTSGVGFAESLPLLERYGVKQFIFGMDGMSAISHEYLRGKAGAFQTVTEAIRVSKAKGFRTDVQFVATRQNVSEIPAFLDYVAKLEIDLLLLHMLTHDGRARGTTDMDLDEGQEFELHRLLQERSASLAMPVLSPYLSMANSNAPCNHLALETINIDWAGRVGPCSILPQFGLPLPSVQRESLQRCLVKVERISERFQRYRAAELPSVRRRFGGCDYCVKRFSDSPGKHLFGARCTMTKGAIDLSRCAVCVYRLRNWCGVDG